MKSSQFPSLGHLHQKSLSSETAAIPPYQVSRERTEFTLEIFPLEIEFFLNHQLTSTQAYKAYLKARTDCNRLCHLLWESLLFFSLYTPNCYLPYRLSRKWVCCYHLGLKNPSSRDMFRPGSRALPAFLSHSLA